MPFLHCPPADDFAKATFNAISATIATELGDKTFCIAAIMAMRYNRAYVFAGALGALIVMSVLSVVIGIAFPALMPRVSVWQWLCFGGDFVVHEPHDLVCTAATVEAVSFARSCTA